MRFNKEFFEKNKPITNEFKLDELIDMNGSAIEGDFNPSYADIQTGPVAKSFNDNSDYVKGIATTTDKIARYAQPRSWWALYYGYGGTPYSHGNKPVSESELSEALVEKKEENEKALLKTKSELDQWSNDLEQKINQMRSEIDKNSDYLVGLRDYKKFVQQLTEEKKTAHFENQKKIEL